ncbi:MAG TPA: rod shape-determining protein MreD, partial [Candidatus Dormibacteraeota bacterium]|nr:rod shape-determining protein MreD [Candidatus Dormibacteraeota bacterium]
MKRVAAFGLIVVLALMQVTWAPHASVLGAFPNLILTAVVAVTWMQGARAGMAWACGGGVLLDLTTSGPIGPHALALLTVAYGTSLCARNFESTPALHAALTAGAGTIAYSVALALADGRLGLRSMDGGLVLRASAAAAVYNAV